MQYTLQNLWNPWILPEFRGIGMEVELKFENIDEVEWNRN
jgi:hypothetical protein